MSEFGEGFTYEDAERVLSEDDETPENLAQIEGAVRKAWLEGKFDLHKANESDLKAFLEGQKGLLQGAKPKTVARIILERYMNGDFFIEYLNNENQGDLRAIFEKHKDRPSVQKILALGGDCLETHLVVETIDELDKLLAEGKTYENAFETIVYSDAFGSNQAFLNHVEERKGVEITNAKDLLKLSGIRKELAGDVKECFTAAIYSRYSYAVARAIREGGKYKDLLAIEPESFGLPSDGWTIHGNRFDKAGEILKAIYSYFQLGEIKPHRPMPLRDIAEVLEAPYSLILTASHARDLGEE